MVELWKFYKEGDWQYFLSNMTKLIDENIDNYKYISAFNIFPDDICLVLAVSFKYMFFNKKENFEFWLRESQPMLDDQSPQDIVKEPNGIKSLKVYLLRYPMLV